jgi:hypothetical protein
MVSILSLSSVGKLILVKLKIVILEALNGFYS